MQYEYTIDGGFGIRQGLDVWAISNDVGYQFEYISDQGSAFSKNIPEIRKLLDSVEYMPSMTRYQGQVLAILGR
jgi:hypothetical protein